MRIVRIRMREQISAFEHTMIQLDAEVLRHMLHLRLDLVFHAAPEPEELPHLARVEDHIGAEKHEFEDQVPAVVLYLLTVTEIWTVDQAAGGPVASDLDAVDGRAEELIVALHDAQVPPDEDEFLGPLLFVAEDRFDPLPHLLLHLESAFGLLFAAKALLDLSQDGVVTASIGPHQRCGGKNVCVVDAPALHDVTKSLVIEGHQAFPEQAVLMPEVWLHVDV